MLERSDLDGDSCATETWGVRPMPMQTRGVWRMRLRLEVRFLAPQIMGFEVKEKQGLVLLVMLMRLEKRTAMKESAWRQLSSVSAKINNFWSFLKFRGTWSKTASSNNNHRNKFKPFQLQNQPQHFLLHNQYTPFKNLHTHQIQHQRFIWVRRETSLCLHKTPKTN